MMTDQAEILRCYAVVCDALLHAGLVRDDATCRFLAFVGRKLCGSTEPSDGGSALTFTDTEIAR